MKYWVIDLSLSKLKQISSDERVFYLYLGHFRNEISVLLKEIARSSSKRLTDPTLNWFELSRSFEYKRLLAGKLLEGWKLITRYYLNKPLSKPCQTQLTTEAREALVDLEAYFGQKNNNIKQVRDNFAFHYSKETYEAYKRQIANMGDSEKLKIYYSEGRMDYFYSASEHVAILTLLEGIVSCDQLEAYKKLADEVVAVANSFIIFTDGCWKYVIQRYLGLSSGTCEVEEIELPTIEPKDQPLELNMKKS